MQNQSNSLITFDTQLKTTLEQKTLINKFKTLAALDKNKNLSYKVLYLTPGEERKFSLSV